MKKYLFIAVAPLLLLQAASAKDSCNWCTTQNPAIQEELLALSKKAPLEILAALREKGICIKILDSKRKIPAQLFHWGKVEAPTDDLSSATKIPGLMGKTLCKGEHELAAQCTTIVLASDAPLSTLFHELLHVKQQEKDKTWCPLSKKLWARTATPAEEKKIRDKEWDVHQFLLENQDSLQFSLEDRLTIADETISEAKARQGFDKKAMDYLEAKQVSQKLQEYMAEYTKAMSNK